MIPMNSYVDSHQHFWQLSRGDYGWLDESLDVIYRDFTPENLRPLLADAGISRTLAIQAAPTDAETAFLLELAVCTDFVAGVVGWIKLDAPDAVPKIDLLVENPWLKGVRPMIQDIPDDDWMLDRKLEPAIRRLVRHRLCFDALVKPRHLPNLLQFLKRYPDLKVVLDHGAKPNIAEGKFDSWADDIANIAAQSNAHCKLSGLLTEAGLNAGLIELKPYMTHLLECFGADRLMWGSDWPVLCLAGSYERWLSIVQDFLQPLEERQIFQIMGGNCVRFYELGDHHTDPCLLRLHPLDNVLVCCRRIESGERLQVEGRWIRLHVSIRTGHKLASRAIAHGEKIIKYGAPIGSAKVDIPWGSHVHLHNMRSDYIASHLRGNRTGDDVPS